VKRIEEIAEGIASVQTGDILQFTGELACMKKRSGKEIRPSNTAERLAWTAEKAERNGFKIITYYSLQPSNAKMIRDKKVIIPSTIFRGLLQVTDAEKFKKTLRNGIGTYRSFGCGMLTVR
jgi:CRISPR system Cascade subunit CasE